MIFVKITIRRYRGGLSVGSLASRAYHRRVHSAWLLNNFFFSIVNWGLMMMVPPRVKFFKNCGNRLVQFVASCSRCRCISCVVNVLGSILKAASLLPATSTMTAAPREPQGSPSASASVCREARASSSAGTSTSAVASSLAPLAARSSLSSL